MPGFPVLHYSQSLLKLISTESVIPSNHLILCHPLLLPSVFPSIRVFSNESVLHVRWPKYWSFSFSISPSNEYSGLISFRMDLFDLLTVQGTLKSLLQHHSSNQFFSAQTYLWSNSHILKRKENLIPHQKLRPGSGGGVDQQSPPHTPVPRQHVPGLAFPGGSGPCPLHLGWQGCEGEDMPPPGRESGPALCPYPFPVLGRPAIPPMLWKVLLSTSPLPAEGS